MSILATPTRCVGTSAKRAATKTSRTKRARKFMRSRQPRRGASLSRRLAKARAILAWRKVRERAEMVVEVREIAEAALHRDVADFPAILGEQLAGATDAQCVHVFAQSL